MPDAPGNREPRRNRRRPAGARRPAPARHHPADQDTELPAGQIAAHFTLTQQAVSQHLTVLKRAGLLEERREGTRRLYRFQPASLEPVRDVLDEFWPDALQRLKRAVERDHPKRGAKGS